MTDLRLVTAAAAFHSTKALYCWCLVREVLETFILKVRSRFAALYFLTDYCSIVCIWCLQNARPKLGSKLLKLAVAQNCCNLKWTRKLHHVMKMIISVYLLCQRKTNKGSKKGSVTTLLLEERPGSVQARGNFSQYYFAGACDRGQPPPHHTWKEKIKRRIHLAIHTCNTGIKQATGLPANWQHNLETAATVTYGKILRIRVESFIFAYCKELNGGEYPLHFNVCVQFG